MVDKKEFSLLSEPWILVMRSDYSLDKLSLLDTLLESHNIKSLAGESKAQDAAIFRLLLAILYTVFTRTDANGNEIEITNAKQAIDYWGLLWDKQKFPSEPVKNYLEKWQEHFWLFHPEYPFYQVPNNTGTFNPAKKLNGEIVESSNKVQLFSISSGEKKERLTYDEAARWLVFLQGYGDTAAKKPSPRLSWLGSIGLIIAKGDNLFESLMYNMALLENGTKPWGEAKPSWEQSVTSEKLRQLPLPDNQPELLTMQCRRVILQSEDGFITGYIEAAGDFIEKENAFCEQMTLWTDIKQKKEVIGHRPKVHEPERQMWRDFSVLVGQKSEKPGIVTWISLVKNKRKLEKSKIISFELSGICYGNMCCGIVDSFSDELQINIALLEELGGKWQHFICDEVENCKQLVKIVENLAYSIQMACGGEGENHNAGEQCYFRLDAPFRQWIVTIDPSDDSKITINEKRKQWRKEAKLIALQLGKELVEQGGTAAIIGREVTKKDKKKETTHFYSAPKAYNYFMYELKKWEGDSNGQSGKC